MVKLIKDNTGRIIATIVGDDESDFESDEFEQEAEQNYHNYEWAFDLVMGGNYEQALKFLFNLPLGQWILLNELYQKVGIASDAKLDDIYVCWLNDVKQSDYKLVGFFHDKYLFSQIVIRLNRLNCL